MAVAIGLTLFATGNDPPKPSTGPALAARAVKIAVGVALLIIAARQWRVMGGPKKPERTPKWRTGIDSMSPGFAIHLGPMVHPWGLVAAGVAVTAAIPAQSPARRRSRDRKRRWSSRDAPAA